MRVRLLHASELELDAPFRDFAGLSPQVRDVVRDASLQAFRRLVDLAVHHRVDALLLTGATYGGPRRGIRAQRAFSQALERLAAEQIQVVWAAGPGDGLRGTWSAVDSWPDAATLVGPGEVTSVWITRAGKRIARAHVAGHGASADDLFRQIVDRDPSPVGATIVLGVGPPGPSSRVAGGRTAPSALTDLVDYWATADSASSHLQLERPPRVVCPGSIQGTGPGPEHRGPKTALLVEVEPAEAPTVIAVATHSVLIEEVRVDATDATSLSDIVTAFNDAAPTDPTADGIIALPALEGDGPLVERLRTDPSPRIRILDALRATASTTSPPRWWDRVRTEPPPLPTTGEEGDDFGTSLVERAAQLIDQLPTTTDPWLADMPPDVLALVGHSADASAREDWHAAVIVAAELLGRSR